MRILQLAKIPYKAYEYDISKGIDAISVSVSLGKRPEQIFKTLVLVGPCNNHFVCIIPANTELDLKKAASFFHVKNLEMLPQKFLLPITGYIHGGCSPIGMKKAFPTVIDERALKNDTFCVSGGKVGLTIELSPKNLADFISADFAVITKD